MDCKLRKQKTQPKIKRPNNNIYPVFKIQKITLFLQKPRLTLTKTNKAFNFAKMIKIWSKIMSLVK